MALFLRYASMGASGKSLDRIGWFEIIGQYEWRSVLSIELGVYLVMNIGVLCWWWEGSWGVSCR